MPQQIIGIIGCVGSGKDTCGDYLINHYKFKKTAYAKKVKDVASIVFSWDRDMMEGSTKESREWREQVDPFWGISPRVAMQKIGTDMFREHIDKDVWIKSVVKEVTSSTDNYVITDCRFENEVEAIKKLGGTILYVERGEIPIWAKEAKEGKPCIKDIHVSDWNPYMLSKYADYTIYNNSTLEDLYKDIDNILKTIS